MIDFIQNALKDYEPALKNSNRKKKTQPTKYSIDGYKTYDLKLCSKGLAENMKAKDIIGLVPTTYEEVMVLGLIVAYTKCDIKDKFEALDYYLSISDVWAINDTVVAALKNSSEEYFDYLVGLLDKGALEGRFAITAMKYNFINDKFIDRIFDILAKLEYGTYYIDMAVAWFLSVAFASQKDKTADFFENAPLPKFVLKNTVFKVKDALFISDEDKIFIEEMYKDIICRREM